MVLKCSGTLHHDSTIFSASSSTRTVKHIPGEPPVLHQRGAHLDLAVVVELARIYMCMKSEIVFAFRELESDFSSLGGRLKVSAGFTWQIQSYALLGMN